MTTGIAAPKPDLGARAKKKHDFVALFKRNFQRKITSGKIEKIADKSLSQPCCSHSNTIYKVQLQNTIVLRMQPRYQATLVPSNLDAAISMRFAATCAHPCSHYNAICIHALQNTKGEPITLETLPPQNMLYCYVM